MRICCYKKKQLQLGRWSVGDWGEMGSWFKSQSEQKLRGVLIVEGGARTHSEYC